MPDQDALNSFGIDELLHELRSRAAQAKEGILSSSEDSTEVTSTNDSALSLFDSTDIAAALTDKQKVIYGMDDRKDLFEVNDPSIRRDADSVVSLFRASQVIDNGDQTSTLATQSFGDANQLCPQERFRSQPIGAFCSGFLVGPDLIATAGHCVTEANVTSIRFVFGFRMQDDLKAQVVIRNSEIYSGSQVLGRILTDAADYAILRLDRPVSNHQIVKIRRSGAIKSDQAVHVIGHPAGLPLKVADGASVRDNTPKEFFVANLDTYGGNSGSPVFNSQTHEVEGILVRGETDFVKVNQCMVSLACPTSGCRGEDCTRTTEFKHLVPEV